MAVAPTTRGSARARRSVSAVAAAARSHRGQPLNEREHRREQVAALARRARAPAPPRSSAWLGRRRRAPRAPRPIRPAWRPSGARPRAASRRTRSSCASRSGSSRSAPCRCAWPWSCARRPARARPARTARRRLWRTAWSARRTTSGVFSGTYSCSPFLPEVLAKLCNAEVLEHSLQRQRHAAALDDRRRLAGVEVEHERRRSLGRLGQRERRVQFQRRQVGQPHERRAIVGEQVVDRLLLARQRDRAHPLRPVRRRLLLKERLARRRRPASA